MIKLAPSILSADFTKLGDEIKLIEKAGADYVHLDVMDGNFVPNLTFGMPVIKKLRSITNMVFDVHLMIEKPERYIKEFADAGADIINIHVEATDYIEKTLKEIKSLGKKTGLTIKPHTSLDDVYKNLDYTDMVLIMSVEPGFGGQSFMPHTLKKTEELANYISKNNLHIDIEMDGGIDLTNVTTVLDVGCNVVVAGSAVYGASDITMAVKEFYNVFKNY